MPAVRFHGILVNMALFSLSRLLCTRCREARCSLVFSLRFSFVFPTIASLPRVVVHQVESPGPILCNATSLRWASVANHSSSRADECPGLPSLSRVAKPRQLPLYLSRPPLTAGHSLARVTASTRFGSCWAGSDFSSGALLLSSSRSFFVDFFDIKIGIGVF